ncbi:MAG: 2-succinylbenzoate--CoA ligase [Cyanobacteria bacterium P01_A01_bin.37]
MTSTRYSTIATRLKTNWLRGIDAQTVATQFEINVATLQNVNALAPISPTVVIAESDPSQFLAYFFAAVALNCPVFLANPFWKASEWTQVWQQVQPAVLWGSSAPEECPSPMQPICHDAASLRSLPMSGWIMIPTGGSSGQVRFVIHTWETLMASVEGFQQFFKLTSVNAYCVLPLYHVSGLMQALRCLVSGGTLAIAPFKQMETSPQLICAPHHFFLSLVPTQLQRLMRSPNHCYLLSQFRTVLLGGAPAWPELLNSVRTHRIPLAPTYGMTETASQVVTLPPDRFLAGHSSVGQSLPHANISIRPLSVLSSTDDAQSHSVGAITIQCASLALGYYPDHFFDSGVYCPDDIGFLDHEGELHLIGRNSDKIISGGENIFPAEVEAAIRATGLVTDVAVLGMSDRHWGEVVTAIIVPAHREVAPTAIEKQLAHRLSRYKHPKRWMTMAQLPRNAQGKLNRKDLMNQAIAITQSQAQD